MAVNVPNKKDIIKFFIDAAPRLNQYYTKNITYRFQIKRKIRKHGVRRQSYRSDVAANCTSFVT